MEKFIKIAESINDLSVFNMYEIVRLTIELDPEDRQFYAYLTLQGTEGKTTFDFHIYPNGSFEEVE